jgi:peptidoglycan hydrolase-like protein with peptidoglycan-binding domain
MPLKTRPLATLTALITLLLALSAGLLAAPAGAASTPTVKPGMKGKLVREVQARLVDAGITLRKPTGTYDKATTAAVKQFQGKFGIKRTGVVSTTTWPKLRALTKGGERLDERCLKGRVICVDKTQKVVRLVKDGKTVQVLDARFGRKGMTTREGAFKVQRKSRDHVSNLYHVSMPYSLFFSGGQAVHYSAEFARIGYARGSHGCVNVRVKSGARKLFDSVKVGDRVIVYRS